MDVACAFCSLLGYVATGVFEAEGGSHDGIYYNNKKNNYKLLNSNGI